IAIGTFVGGDDVFPTVVVVTSVIDAGITKLFVVIVVVSLGRPTYAPTQAIANSALAPIFSPIGTFGSKPCLMPSFFPASGAAPVVFSFVRMSFQSLTVGLPSFFPFDFNQLLKSFTQSSILSLNSFSNVESDGSIDSWPLPSTFSLIDVLMRPSPIDAFIVML